MSSDKNSHLQIGNKTAKSIVMEICVKLKVVPKWDTTDISTSLTSPRKFKCVCTVVPTTLGIELIGEGVGGTKKEAEHMAALELIPQILTPAELLQVTTGAAAVMGRKEEAVIDNEPVSDTDDEVMAGEPIGDLKNLCVKYNLECPQYSETQKRGAGNTNIFTVTCRVSSSFKTGRRLRVKDAKRMAAFRVLREIKAQGYSTVTAEKPKLSIIKSIRPVPTQQSAVSSSTSTASPSSSTGMNKNESSLSLDGDSLQRSLALIMERLKNSARKKGNSTEPMDVGDGQSVASSSSSAEATKDIKQSMELDSSIAHKIKRKLEEQHDALVALSPLNKRRYDPFIAVKCDMPSEQCLQFVKDYAHGFNHLDNIDSMDEAFLISKQFQQLLNRHGGSLNLFIKSAADLKMKYHFGPFFKLTGDDKSTCVFLSMKFPLKLEQKTHNTHVVHGIGSDNENAKQDAAFKALKFIRLMIFDTDVPT